MKKMLHWSPYYINLNCSLKCQQFVAHSRLLKHVECLMNWKLIRRIEKVQFTGRTFDKCEIWETYSSTYIFIQRLRDISNLSSKKWTLFQFSDTSIIDIYCHITIYTSVNHFPPSLPLRLFFYFISTVQKKFDATLN